MKNLDINLSTLFPTGVPINLYTASVDIIIPVDPNATEYDVEITYEYLGGHVKTRQFTTPIDTPEQVLSSKTQMALLEIAHEIAAEEANK